MEKRRMTKRKGKVAGRILLVVMALVAAGPVHSQPAGEGPWTGADDVLRFLPLASAYALKGCGVESASDWQRLVVNSAISLAASSAVTYGLKYSVRSERPDHTDRHGFPSGHAMFAFCGATVLHREYSHRSPWISVAGYVTATAVAVERVRHDRHNWYQTASGAAIGILGTEVGYWLGDRLTGNSSQLSLVPTTNGLYLSYRF